jgi:hypothetical protein
MLTVWCVCVGDKYSDADVLILRDMVSRNLSIDYQFRCLSDRVIPGVECLLVDPWPGWWSKLLLFRYAEGLNLYLDLDVVVTGPLDGLLSHSLSMPKNWAMSGHGGWQSSVMAWDGNYKHIPDQFNPELLSEPGNGNYGYYGNARLWGDQEFITEVMGNRVVPMFGVYSYKYHCRESLPADCAVACFHGNPKPGEVGDRWVIESRSTAIPA